MNLPAICQIAFDYYSQKRSHPWKEIGNKYYHGQRVAKLALSLRKRLFPDDASHDQVLTVAAWFHDIANGQEDHTQIGAQQTRVLLHDECSAHELDEICSIIAVHDDRLGDCCGFSNTLKLHQDADHLDHFGTYDVWAEFFIAAHDDIPIEDVIHWFRVTRREEEQTYRDELHFEISKQIMAEKDAFVRSFGERMSVEFSGGIWREQDLGNP